MMMHALTSLITSGDRSFERKISDYGSITKHTSNTLLIEVFRHEIKYIMLVRFELINRDDNKYITYIRTKD